MNAKKEEMAKSGLSIRQAALALLVILAGALGMFLSVYYDWSISLGKSIRMPYWVLTVVGIGLVMYGAYSLYLSFSARKCVRCLSELELAEVSFQSESKDALKSALLNGDYAALENIPMAREYGDSLTLQVQFCPRCRDAALIALDHVVSWNPRSVLGERLVRGAAIGELIRLAETAESSD